MSVYTHLHRALHVLDIVEEHESVTHTNVGIFTEVAALLDWLIVGLGENLLSEKVATLAIHDIHRRAQAIASELSSEFLAPWYWTLARDTECAIADVIGHFALDDPDAW